MNNIARITTIIIAVVSLVFSASQSHAATASNCSDTSIMSALTSFEDAIAAKNLAAIDPMIDAAYLDGGENKTNLMTELNSMLSQAQSAQLAFSNVECSILGNGNADIRALETFSATINSAPFSEVNKTHIILKPSGNSWVNYGNQLNFRIMNSTGTDGANNKWLNVFIEDMHSVIQSAVLSGGPGLNGGGALSSSACSWNNAPSTCWSTYNAGTNMSVLAPDPINLPLNYILTITDKNNVVTTHTLAFNAWQTNLATNLSPSGNLSSTAAPVFTWMAPTAGGPYSYGVSLDVVTASGPSQIWSNYGAGSATSLSYTGTALTAGSCYKVSVYANDIDGNVSQASSYFGVNLANGATCGPVAYPINVSVTGVTTAVTNVQVCVNAGANSFCGPNGGFAVGQSGTISVTANSGMGYTVTVPGNQPAAAYCTVTSGGGGVLGTSMPTAVVNCSGNAQTDTTAPTIPSGLSAMAANLSQIDLSWTASTDNVGVTAYKVYRGGNLIATLGNVTSYSDNGLTASTAYSYTVAACDAANNCSMQSAAASATTLASSPTTYTLSIASNGNGAVTSNPSGINCGSTCSASFNQGAVVTLTASPATGYSFSGWSGACTGTGSCQVTMNAAQNVAASFAATQNAATANLVSGWNLVGNGMSGAITVATDALLSDPAKVNTIWKWLPATASTQAGWAFYAPSLTDGGAAYAASKGYTFLTTINGGEGFWVNAKASFSLTLPTGTAINTNSLQDALTPPNPLPSGWSLIAVGDNPTPRTFVNGIAQTPPAAGTVAATSLTTLWAWYPGNGTAQPGWYFYAPSLDNSGGLSSYITSKGYLEFGTTTLTPTTGFWVNHP